MKEWFNKQKQFFEQADIFHKWCEFNQEQVNDFIEKIPSAVNIASQNLEMSKLKD